MMKLNIFIFSALQNSSYNFTFDEILMVDDTPVSFISVEDSLIIKEIPMEVGKAQGGFSFWFRPVDQIKTEMKKDLTPLQTPMAYSLQNENGEKKFATLFVGTEYSPFSLNSSYTLFEMSSGDS